MTKKEAKGPQFIKFIDPVIQVLKGLGGSGTAGEVKDLVIELLKIPDSDVEKTIKTGGSRIENQIAWARLYLVKSNYLDSSKRGIWSLTEKGINTQSISKEEAFGIFTEVQSTFKKSISQNNQNKEDFEIISGLIDEFIEDHTDHRKQLLDLLQKISPSGFERLCQRLLRESGFQQVNVTGKTGDGGIDGVGILEINPLVSFKVIFQCKRYSGTVSSPQIRDFRGAMMGRADKGIIITTGRFSIDAKKEAVRDGVPPIDLIDGEKLVEMFEKLELGLKQHIVYDLDIEFFNDYQ